MIPVPFSFIRFLVCRTIFRWMRAFSPELDFLVVRHYKQFASVYSADSRWRIDQSVPVLSHVICNCLCRSLDRFKWIDRAACFRCQLFERVWRLGFVAQQRASCAIRNLQSKQDYVFLLKRPHSIVKLSFAFAVVAVADKYDGK